MARYDTTSYPIDIFGRSDDTQEPYQFQGLISGFLDEVRFTRALRYTQNFTPPTRSAIDGISTPDCTDSSVNQIYDPLEEPKKFDIEIENLKTKQIASIKISPRVNFGTNYNGLTFGIVNRSAGKFEAFLSECAGDFSKRPYEEQNSLESCRLLTGGIIRTKWVAPFTNEDARLDPQKTYYLNIRFLEPDGQNSLGDPDNQNSLDVCKTTGCSLSVDISEIVENTTCTPQTVSPGRSYNPIAQNSTRARIRSAQS